MSRVPGVVEIHAEPVEDLGEVALVAVELGRRDVPGSDVLPACRELDDVGVVVLCLYEAVGHVIPPGWP